MQMDDQNHLDKGYSEPFFALSGIVFYLYIDCVLIVYLFIFDVLFIIEAQAGICQTVRCELLFSEEWTPEAIMGE